jgi:DNA-binding MarR family transcriptional regulator
MERQELAEEIVRRFLILLRHQHRFGHQLSRDMGISGKQLSALRFLIQNGPTTVSAISRHLYVSDGTASPLLERMEQAGLVTRQRCSRDARRLLVECTELGRDMAARAPLGLVSRLRLRLPELSAEELEQIHSAFVKLYEIAEIDPSELD